VDVSSSTVRAAGGVVHRRDPSGRWQVLLVHRPRYDDWSLPKGHLDDGERPMAAAVREVLEETGLVAEPVRKLEPIKYVYQRAGERIFKVVTFWVMAPVGGELGVIAEEMRVEVAEAAWIPLADAPRLLAYRGEKKMVADLVAEE
jgi:8-oxo-dGTP pyrophosphatase MutT (NUDIX family)